MRWIALVLVAFGLASCAGERSAPSSSSTTTPSVSATASPDPIPSETPAPIGDGAFAFAVVGDTGSAFQSQYDVADRMCRWRDKHRFDHVFTTGDNIYPSGQPSAFQDAFFEPYACLLDGGVRWHAALGNHDIVTDGGRPEMDEPAFGIRGRNYVVRKGSVRFVVADSNSWNMRWLRQRTRSQDGDRWTVVIFHHPVFSAGDSHGPTPGLAERLTELFVKRGVDLVLNGHDHVYSVSKPIGGVRYVVTGGGGATLNGCRAAVSVTKCVSRNHFLYVSVNDRHMKVYAVPPRGAPFDSVKVLGN